MGSSVCKRPQAYQIRSELRIIEFEDQCGRIREFGDQGWRIREF